MPIEWGYAVALLAAGLVSVSVARTAWLRRRSPGSAPLVGLMLSLAFWSFTYALHWLRVPEPRPLFWVDVTYLGVVTNPVFFLAFGLHFTGRGNWLKPSRLVWLIAIPTITLVLLWTDPWHGLFFGDMVRSVEQAKIYSGGIWFYVHVAYSYGLILLTLGLFVQALLRAKGLYRQQIGAMLTGALIPIIVNAAALAGYDPFPDLDITPLAFTLTGGFFALALYRLGLFDIVPIARDSVVEEMSDGVLVIDTQNRVVDINPAARQLIGLTGDLAIGRTAADLLSAWPETVERFRHTLDAQEEIQLPGDPPRTIDLRITGLYGRGKVFRGRLIILRDITERVQIEDQLRQLNERLKGQLSENVALQSQLREQAIRDPLTGVFNRRYLEESLAREIAQRQRDERPLSIAMLDIDRFKTFNDSHGHAAGDRMLQGLAQILRGSTRAGDIVCRFGGEEFVVVMPGASRSTALLRMDYVRQTFQTLVLEHEGKPLSSTLSAGVASHPEDGATPAKLLDSADQAMYLAKQRGRNVVTTLGEA